MSSTGHSALTGHPWEAPTDAWAEGGGCGPCPTESGAPNRGQQFAQQMQQQNPELIEQLRSQIRSRTPSASNDDQQE